MSAPASPASWFGLSKPADLFRKLEYDLTRMEADPHDAHPAFDFFVTALHLLDWQFPGDPGSSDARERANVQQRSTTLRAEPLMQVCAHIANGVKDLEVRRHTAVKDTEVIEPAFSQGFSSGFATKATLVVDLTGTIPGRNREEAVVLAREILAWWRARLF